jgi:uncharacterized OB-fold protein
MATPRFWREIPSRYNLLGTKCGSCGTLDFPPRAVCPKCGRRSVGKMMKQRLSGIGSIISYTVVYDAPSSYELLKPYVLAVIELKEGARLTSQIIDVEPGDVKIGMQVEAAFRRLGQEGEAGILQYGYKFKPVTEQGKDA